MPSRGQRALKERAVDDAAAAAGWVDLTGPRAADVGVTIGREGDGHGIGDDCRIRVAHTTRLRGSHCVGRPVYRGIPRAEMMSAVSQARVSIAASAART